MVHVREGNGTPLQYSCLENPMDGGAWRASRGTTRTSGSLSCGAREVRSPCAWRGGAFPLDLGARPLCRRLRGRGCANCQSLPQAELFVRQRERPGLSQGASERRGILWRWRGPSGLRWVWRNGRGPHLEGRQEPQASSAFRTPTAGSLQSWDRRVRPRLV